MVWGIRISGLGCRDSGFRVRAEKDCGFRDPLLGMTPPNPPNVHVRNEVTRCQAEWVLV